MTYDIHLIRRTAEQSWEDAFEAFEETAGDTPSVVTDATRQRWDRLATELQRRWPGFERNDGPDFVELTDLDSGLQVFLHVDECELTVPYLHEDTGLAAVNAASRCGRRYRSTYQRAASSAV